MNSFLILGRAFLLMTILYKFSLGYYTFYGLTKSYQEYFCKQRRADSPDYTTRGNYKSINLTNAYIFKNGDIEKQMKYQVIGVNGSLLVYKKLNNELEEPTGYKNSTYFVYKNYEEHKRLKMQYKYNTSYFELNCFTSDTEFNPVFISNKSTDYYFMGYDLQAIDDYGYINDRTQFPWFKLGIGSHRIGMISCETKKSPETCTLKQETRDKFYFYYIISISTMAFLGVLCFTSFKRNFFLRMLSSSYGVFEALADNKSFFCNPITGKQVYLNKGEKVYKITLGPENQVDTEGINYFTDKEGVYIVQKTFVHANCKNVKKIFRMGEGSLNSLKEYFLAVSMNHKMCVVNDTETHYFSTLEVIEKMSQGYCLYVSEKMDDGYVLEIKELEFKMIGKAYKINSEITKKILEHNWRFFGNRYSMKSLINCLNCLTWSRNRPKGVKNTQWKWYTSDFRIIMEGFGLTYNSQVKWGPSNALMEIEKIDTNLLPITSVTGTEKTVFFSPEVSESCFVSEMKKLVMIDEFEYNFVNTPEHNGLSDKDKLYYDAVRNVVDRVNSLRVHKSALEIKNMVTLKEYVEGVVESKVADLNETIRTYKEVLLSPPTVLTKTQLNKKEKLKSKIRNGKNVEESKALINEIEKSGEVCKTKGEIEDFLLNSVNNITSKINQIYCYKRQQNITKEFLSEKKNIGEGKSEMMKFKTSDIFRYGIFYKKRRVSNKKEGKKLEYSSSLNSEETRVKRIKKGHLLINKSMLCDDLEENFNKSIQMINDGKKEIKELKEKKQNINVKTVHTLKKYLENKCKTRIKEVELSSYLHSRWEENKLKKNSLDIFIEESEEVGLNSEFFRFIKEIKDSKEERRKHRNIRFN